MQKLLNNGYIYHTMFSVILLLIVFNSVKMSFRINRIKVFEQKRRLALSVQYRGLLLEGDIKSYSTC